jgi:hypothetical protein
MYKTHETCRYKILYTFFLLPFFIWYVHNHSNIYTHADVSPVFVYNALDIKFPLLDKATKTINS